MNLNPAFKKTLETCIKASEISWDPAICITYSYDNSRYHAIPDGVIFAASHKEVVTIATLCNEYRVPLIARGRGTGTPGGSIPINGGIVLSFERMDQIKQIDPNNRILIAEPGVLNQTVQNAAKAHGFFWAPDPSSAAYCTIGGNLSYNSAGPRAIKYGTCRENTLGLRAVTGEGKSIHTGVYTSKGVVGYDLTRLLIGSEGTLALITEATLKLLPLPEDKHTLRVLYNNTAYAAHAVAAIMSQPHTPCALEFMDSNALRLIREHTSLSLPKEAHALLMIEVDGATAALPAMSAAIQRAATNEGLIECHLATTPAEITALWHARKILSPTLKYVAPKKINEDVVVPVSTLPLFLETLNEYTRTFQLTIVNFGHAGNGNIHVNLLIDPTDPTQVQHAEQCLDRVFTEVLALGGTLSGEHGVGIDKRPFIEREIETPTLELMKQIKHVFDPNGILNPGKIFP